MPPYFNVDETNHVMRAETVLQGSFLGERKADGTSGGPVDSGLLTLLSRYWPVLAQPDQVMTPDLTAEAATIPWSGERMFVHIPNTAIYPPSLYLPTIVGLGVGKLLDLSVQDSLLLARFVNMAVAVSLIALALRLAAFGHGPMLLVALWPMCLSQYAACSQDGLFVALTALYVALLSRAMMAARRATMAEFLGLAGLIVLLSMSRPTNLALLLPVLLVMPARVGRMPAWIVPAATVLLPVAWSLHAVMFVQVMQVHDGIVPDMRAQLGFMAAHPGAFPAAMVTTLREWWWPFTVAMLGWIGWSHVNIVLPELAYTTYILALPVMFGLAMLRSDTPVAPRLKGGVVLALLGTVLAIFLLQYLTFSAVGASQVGGVQGRYFSPLALMLALLPPALGRWPALRPVLDRVQPWLPAAGLAVLLGTAALTATVLPIAVLFRLYLPG